jgi:hypothetical protein
MWLSQISKVYFRGFTEVGEKTAQSNSGRRRKQVAAWTGVRNKQLLRFAAVVCYLVVVCCSERLVRAASVP